MKTEAPLQKIMKVGKETENQSKVTGPRKYRYIYTYDKAVKKSRFRFIKKK